MAEHGLEEKNGGDTSLKRSGCRLLSYQSRGPECRCLADGNGLGNRSLDRRALDRGQRRLCVSVNLGFGLLRGIKQKQGLGRGLCRD